jgi:proteasome lid subunit RPN8/RPN11
MDNGDALKSIRSTKAELEIQFGQIEHQQPQPGLRPDQDRHFVVVECGRIEAHDLPIYVELDVMRDMEAHARENQAVELGGVMLGHQLRDADGQPFVVISESLRAKYYHATKGSFKFTHDTWNEITRERNEFRPDLELVGWYHTHPGWGVFLSGMDLFICQHFFSRPLDVALVIDPTADQRGWFQWSQSAAGSTEQTSGFYLYTNRHRRLELNYFLEILGGQRPTWIDPRFRQPSFDQNAQEFEDSMVNMIENRRPLLDLTIVSMLFLQLLLAGLLMWRFFDRPADDETESLRRQLAAVEARLELNQQKERISIREQAYGEILEQLVSQQTGESGLVERTTSLIEENKLLAENLQGQLARIELAEKSNQRLTQERDIELRKSQTLETALKTARQSLDESLQINNELRAQVETKQASNETMEKKVLPPWLVYSLGGLILLAAGAFGGSLVTNRIANNRFSNSMHGAASDYSSHDAVGR